jgi:hypothetical protein
MENKKCASCYYCCYCEYCNSTASSASCAYCDYCTFCSSCYYCKNLKMTEHNYFCWSEKYNDENSFQQKRYRVFNVEVGKEEYEKIKKIYHKLTFDKNEGYDTRLQTAFKKMWEKLKIEERQEYLSIPHFNWTIFTEITGITPDDVTIEEKNLSLK